MHDANDTFETFQGQTLEAGPTAAKHTPGPWVMRPHEDLPGDRFLGADVHSAGGSFVADCGSHDKANTNAALIAAAPELLESLTNLVGLAEIAGPGLRQYKAALDDARAAIAKACGGVR